MAEWTGTPAYKQVATELRRRLGAGQHPLGSQLPSIPDLMREFDVSVTVVRQALSQLRSEGLITSHQGKGSFVRALPGDTADTAPDGSTAFRMIMEQLDSLGKRFDQMQDQLETIDSRLDHLENPSEPQQSARPAEGSARSE